MVVILGNGFDLNLGLKTGYQHFVKSKYFADLVTKENALAIYLKSKNELQKWIDIENELKLYSYKIYRDDNRKIFKAEYKALCQSLCSYLNDLDYSMIDIDSLAYNLILKLCQGDGSITIYNFNYTKSIDHILAKEKLEANIINVVNMHGNAEKGDIIFGVEDGAQIDRRDVFLLKSTSPNFVCDVNLSNILKQDEELLVVGHSLGETDHFYFKDFFYNQTMTCAEEKNIQITYHGEDGRDSIMMQLNQMTMNRISALRQCNIVRFTDTE